MSSFDNLENDTQGLDFNDFLYMKAVPFFTNTNFLIV